MTLREQMEWFRTDVKEIDKYQHHGPYFLMEKMLYTYLESYLPLAVWYHSKVLYGDGLLHFCPIKSRYHDKLWFEKSVLYYNDLHDYYVHDECQIYQNKRFVCMANMIPAITYPFVTGKYATKDYTTAWFQKRYPFAIDWLNNCRDRRLNNYYHHLEPFIEQTREVINKVKEVENGHTL
jgi:hypothetical protein